MRAMLAALCLITVLAAAPGAEASCHFCLEDTLASCSALERDACADNATYMGTHLPAHVLEPTCATLDC